MTKKKQERPVAEPIVELRTAEEGTKEGESTEGVVEEAIASEEERVEEQDELKELQAELEKAQAQAAEYLDGWQRAQAEFSNYKKRQDSERVQMMVLAGAALLRRLLPVVDDFDRALASMPAESNQSGWAQGILLIKQKLDGLLESEGVKPIETQGKTFDPLYHEAVTYEEAGGYAEGQIISEAQRGYILGERVLRPALVRVAKGPASQHVESNSSQELNTVSKE